MGTKVNYTIPCVIGRLLPVNSDKIHQNQEVYSVCGIICCLKSTHYKDPPKILEISNATNLFYNAE